MSLSDLATLELKQGDSWTRVLTYLEDDETTPIDLTDCSVEFSLAKARRKTPKWTFTSSPNAAITDAAAGEITIYLSPDDTRAFGKLEELQYEVTITFADDSRLTILEGPLLVRLEVAEEGGDS